MENLASVKTETFKKFIKKKGISPESVAEKLDMSKQNLYLLYKKEYFKTEVSEKLISLYGKEIVEEESKDLVNGKSNIFTVEKMLEVMDENRKLWSVIARHGISVNFNSGVSASAYGNFF